MSELPMMIILALTQANVKCSLHSLVVSEEFFKKWLNYVKKVFSLLRNMLIIITFGKLNVIYI